MTRRAAVSDVPIDERAAELRCILEPRLRRRHGTPEFSILGAGGDLDTAVATGRSYLALMDDIGLASPGWPTEHGGAGMAPDHLDLLAEVLEEYERPDLYVFLIGLGTAGPMIIRHGTDTQRARYLDAIRTGSEIWCQLFSEPDAGSDLAALRTRARHDGDQWVVNGHKFWVSRASVAEWGLLLARTDPAAPSRHGITAFILPMDAPGVTVAPIRQMNGDRHFYEVFLDDVRLDDELRLGPLNQGWQIALETLSAERTAAGSLGGIGLAPDSVIDLVAASASRADPIVRQQAAHAFTLLTLLTVARTTRRPEGHKLVFAAATRAFVDLTRLIRGADGLLDDGRWTVLELTAPSLSIRGGTDEIQRNLIGERVLGLPREPRVPS